MVLLAKNMIALQLFLTLAVFALVTVLVPHTTHVIATVTTMVPIVKLQCAMVFSLIVHLFAVDMVLVLNITRVIVLHSYTLVQIVKFQFVTEFLVILLKFVQDMVHAMQIH